MFRKWPVWKLLIVPRRHLEWLLVYLRDDDVCVGETFKISKDYTMDMNYFDINIKILRRQSKFIVAWNGCAFFVCSATYSVLGTLLCYFGEYAQFSYLTHQVT